jgi:hypothetical protein
VPTGHTYASALVFGATDFPEAWERHERWAASSTPLTGVSSYCIHCHKCTWRTEFDEPHEALIDSVSRKTEAEAALGFMARLRNRVSGH